MLVGLTKIPTLRDLYKASVLRAVELSKTRAQPKAPLLDRVSLYQGDITTLEVDAIVNAANRSLLGGSGVDGAIHAASGPGLLNECRKLNGCDTGDAKITKGYNLPSENVIHTVGPVYSSANADVQARLLQSCYRTSLQLAAQNSLKHIAFPSISTGIYGYPIEDATHIALDTVRQFLDSSHADKLERVVFVVWSDDDKEVYEDLIPVYFPKPSEYEDVQPLKSVV
ncbi:A1pp-domain-containing protein [Wolfiporia cocos MD-104 SS10]|uniref:A1pp-domain-containing protein n=1 Tax=Wolfiporia cocos (strain MD-104) TaxID=742152 RepID=A0A2H3JJ89_WOLCO|nr:A1pp-domain-containing protein [Wolfiporia cocos MD-104 SS10]